MDIIKYDELFEQVAGTYISTNLPDNWKELSEDDINRFLKDNAWRPFEYHSGKEIYFDIEDIVKGMVRFLKEKGIKVVD